jgi:hypothetical protein
MITPVLGILGYGHVSMAELMLVDVKEKMHEEARLHGDTYRGFSE